MMTVFFRPIQRAMLTVVLLAMTAITAYGQATVGNLTIYWPEEYNWKVGTDNENEKLHMLELVPGNESVKAWTIIGVMLSMKNVRNVRMDAAMSGTLATAEKMGADSRLTLIEKNDSAKYPWAIFTIETASFKNGKAPESLVFYIIQGNSGLYINNVGIKAPTLSKEFVEKWAAVFRKSELSDQ